ncbi:hypothetical protein AB3X52_04590 [Nocardioides sp. DS6]|uniref:Uncharacterized protein n=1 Tax=Nocardioides eburneus TaxID=3231482 RepID=A0ABV3SVD1_9ACTN
MPAATPSREPHPDPLVFDIAQIRAVASAAWYAGRASATGNDDGARILAAITADLVQGRPIAGAALLVLLDLPPAIAEHLR